MSVQIVMPQLGLTMTEGTVSTWLKQTGESVKTNEIVLTVATDKVDMDVESPADGTLGDILVQAGTTVPVGTVLTHIFIDGAKPKNLLSQPGLPTSTKEPSPSAREETPGLESPRSTVKNGRPIASPLARKVAAARGIELATVTGSGPRGRIVAADLERVTPQAVVSKETVDPNARRRRLIANRMVASINTIPSFSVSVEADARQLVILYENLRSRIEQQTKAKLTYTDLLLKAVAVGISRTPEMNAVWEEANIRPLSSLALAMAVATDRGVVAPVLNEVDTLPLEHLVQSRLQITQRARENKLTLADMEGASGTLSNLGMYRVDSFEGIITPGQTFILAVGRLKERPWVLDGSLIVASTLILNLSVDHRVVDGEIAAQFLAQVTEAIENPYQLLWNVASEKSRR
jgi:pyruvate dehydrogenase E2 component (dihydrolipoamide acetyltransferase)